MYIGCYSYSLIPIILERDYSLQYPSMIYSAVA